MKQNASTAKITIAKDLGDQCSIPGRAIPKTQKMLLDAFLLNIQHYKVWIKGKVVQSRRRSSALGVIAIEKGAFRSSSTKVATLFLKICNIYIHRGENRKNIAFLEARKIVGSYMKVKTYASVEQMARVISSNMKSNLLQQQWSR